MSIHYHPPVKGGLKTKIYIYIFVALTFLYKHEKFIAYTYEINKDMCMHIMEVDIEKRSCKQNMAFNSKRSLHFFH